MKQILEIKVPDGKKAVWKDNKVIFEDIKPQLPKTWEEFCESSFVDKGYFIGTGSKIICYEKTFRYPIEDKNLLPSEEAVKAHLALIQLHQLRDCYRQGWKPDWSENRTVKHNIVHYNGEGYGVFASYTTPVFLSFQSMEIAEEFLNNFRELIEQAGDLI